MTNNGWDKYQKVVLDSLERNESLIQKIDEKLDKFTLDASVKIVKIESDVRNKAGIWGAIAGMIPITIMILFMVARRFM